MVNANAKALGVGRMNNQVAIDMLQPGDVLVVDLFGMDENGTIVGDNLFYYIMKATKGAGLVVDGAIRDLEGIRNMAMPAYFRTAHPTAIGNVMMTGINMPVRIGRTTVMPGDLVFGDVEGVYFIPPALVEPVLDNADVTHVHDEWTRMKFDEGKYKSREIYGSPTDPALQGRVRRVSQEAARRDPREVPQVVTLPPTLALQVRERQSVVSHVSDDLVGHARSRSVPHVAAHCHQLAGPTGVGGAGVPDRGESRFAAAAGWAAPTAHR